MNAVHSFDCRILASISAAVKGWTNIAVSPKQIVWVILGFECSETITVRRPISREQRHKIVGTIYRFTSAMTGKMNFIRKINIEMNWHVDCFDIIISRQEMIVMDMRFALGLTAAFVVATASGAMAQGNPPPAGTAVGSLTGLPVTGTVNTYTTTFVAGSTSTDLAIAIREDPAFISISNVSLVDLTNVSANLLINGDFTGGTYTSSYGTTQPNGWTYLNPYNAGASGTVQSCSFGSGTCYFDGSVGSYDAIDQNVATVVGDTYQVSFLYNDNGSSGGTYAPVAGDAADYGDPQGRDLYVYAGTGTVTAGTTVPPVNQGGSTTGTDIDVPEPLSLTLLGSALAGLGLVRRRR